MLELVQTVQTGEGLRQVKGIAYRENGKTVVTPARDFMENLDDIPFPARETFDNRAYQRYYSTNFGYTTTSVMTSRGCPFECDSAADPFSGTCSDPDLPRT